MRTRPETIKKIELINKVGVNKLRIYAHKHHPRENVERNIQMMRDYLKYGSDYVVMKYDIDSNTPTGVIRRYYRYALAVIGGESSNG